MDNRYSIYFFVFISHTTFSTRNHGLLLFFALQSTVNALSIGRFIYNLVYYQKRTKLAKLTYLMPRINIELEAELHKKAKLQALLQNKTLIRYIHEALEKKVSEDDHHQ